VPLLSPSPFSFVVRYKWDAVESCFRSILGLQARKLQEVAKQPGSDVLDSLQLRSGSIKTGLVSWFKGLAGTKAQLGSGASYGTFELAAAGGSLAEESEGEADQGGMKAQGLGLAGGSGGDTMLGGAAAVLAAAADPLDLVREVALAKQKAKKVTLLLGSNVPPLLMVPQGASVGFSEGGAAGPEGG